MKKLPANARDLVAARRSGLIPASRQVSVTLDYSAGFINWESVAVPLGSAVTQFEWSFLRDLWVLIRWDSRITGESRAIDLASCILAANPSALVLLDLNPFTKTPMRFIKSTMRGIEEAL
ncbi:hypothetical protein [Nitrogeniibacter aestuarii]|uniref:hypothetical protein n=1 Tax=Nitrogeniibacter aestuarii TaxID=2815343 RepID=UPI001D128F81|nr:hypothetical protein [Nitrogeniibacter aestuarii]